ncbi:MAG: TspO protein [Candidatus Buchananbacteria bacterium CG10_big_fil_rev_8_21_14_0_10_42_9]|uniref:TspO protein n=1 Tax=Candidatus Buchananbacteria bacterium CG10_big_fil_rev_8_21_14_0_10_42_9 TaxID=1974526 RepID=A0A2H0VZM5_9BACT|nr:MAG: TspO protein [Candidatus Buchananbacteria bacterium CG10_big_fil_rev_8_21_14_0_10_42_9]
MNNPIKLVVALILPQLAGAIGSFFTAPAIDSWYINLNKPSFNPPSWVFGPVWITLYILMGIAMYLIWVMPKSKTRDTALAIYLAQLVLNSLWSIVFFGWQSIGLAFGVIVILLVLVLIITIKFHQLKKIAGYLLVPYFLWGAFATILNGAIWYLN